VIHKVVDLIGYACGAGAGDTRARQGSLACEAQGLDRQLQQASICSQWKGQANSTLIEAEGHIADACAVLSRLVSESILEQHFPVTIGGDHSIAMGTWHGVTSTLKARGKFGLLWVDAHMDAHTLASSESGNIHGMPLSYLLGRGDGVLADFLGDEPLLSPAYTALLGVRSFEKPEKELLEQLGVRIYFMEEIIERGFEVCFKEALTLVKEAPAGYGITIDIDAIDPEEAPGTGVKEAGGLHAGELCNALQEVQGDAALKALEIAEFNPAMDEGNKTYQIIYQMIESVAGEQGDS
jgi:arginase